MYTLLVLYCVLIAIASALGGSIPSLVKLTHQRIQLTISLVSGVMLGVALLHLLPHAIFVLKSPERALGTCLVGLLFMFFMVRMFHFHQHDLAVDAEHDHLPKELCDHDNDQHHVHCDHHGGQLDLSWAGLCFGLCVHTLIDGIALAAAVQATSTGGLSVAGMGVFLAIVLHKPLDALSITSLMAARGWSVSKQMTVSVLFALMCPLGAILFAVSIDQFVDYRNLVLGYALAFSAGIFLCISLGDLLPEVHFHSHDRLKLSAMLLLGVLIALGIELLPGHEHQVGVASISNATCLRQAEQLLAVGDNDGDGKLSPPERQALRIDLNNDGLVDVVEVATMLKFAYTKVQGVDSVNAAESDALVRKIYAAMKTEHQQTLSAGEDF